MRRHMGGSNLSPKWNSPHCHEMWKGHGAHKDFSHSRHLLGGKKLPHVQDLLGYGNLHQSGKVGEAHSQGPQDGRTVNDVAQSRHGSLHQTGRQFELPEICDRRLA
mmetsp:Transcript_71333/g.137756  ORF Transcript_71333/g.137756 Transcript_71333/m.137756 type:complete len:106 (+) Transcript_71333:275-592(+)